MRKILIFDLKGKYAHFKKFFTNSSALSYTIPPRTTIIGIIAAILGRDRDSYYEEFSKEKCEIGIQKLCKTLKMTNTLNYEKYIRSNDAMKNRKFSEHTQIPVEIIIGKNIEDNIKTENMYLIKYRIFLWHENEQIMENLYTRLNEKEYYYSPYFGIASFNCWSDYVDWGNMEVINKEKANFVGPVNSKVIRNFKIKEGLFLTKERMPADFDANRILKEANDYVFDENGQEIEMSLNSKYAHIEFIYNNDKKQINILFL